MDPITEYKDNSDKCGLRDGDDMKVCAPNPCKEDNGYNSHCNKCLCRSCTRSDCHKEHLNTWTSECFGCVLACKVEYLGGDYYEPPDGCIMGLKDVKAEWDLA